MSEFLFEVVKIDRKGFVCVALQDLKSGTLIKIIKERPQILVLGQTGFMGSEFGIFGGFWWVCGSVLVGKPGFGRASRVRSSSQFEVFSKMFMYCSWVPGFVGFGWVCSSVLVGKPGFERVGRSTFRVRSSSKFVIFGFNPTLTDS